MELFFFLIVAFIIYSSVASSSKKQIKQSKSQRHQATASQDWRENYDPAQADAAYEQGLARQSSKRANFQIDTKRVVNSTATVTRKTTNTTGTPRKLRFGVKAVAEDKNRTRSRGFSTERTRVLLDGKRVFALVAIAFLVVYIMGQI